MLRIGAHPHQPDPLAAALDRGADLVQFFLGDPQGWAPPVLPGGPEVDQAEFRQSFEAAGVDIYIHAPYRINVATTNNRIRIPSRKLLEQHAAAPVVCETPDDDDGQAADIRWLRAQLGQA